MGYSNIFIVFLSKWMSTFWVQKSEWMDKIDKKIQFRRKEDRKNSDIKFFETSLNSARIYYLYCIAGGL